MESFVVQLIGTESSQPFKYFGSRATAQDFAASRVQSKEAESANIYRVTGAANPYEAVGMVKAGKATLIHARSRHATDAEALEANERAWQKPGKPDRKPCFNIWGTNFRQRRLQHPLKDASEAWPGQ
jgi:hypothetical protein